VFFLFGLALNDPESWEVLTGGDGVRGGIYADRARERHTDWSGFFKGTGGGRGAEYGSIADYQGFSRVSLYSSNGNIGIR